MIMMLWDTGCPSSSWFRPATEDSVVGHLGPDLLGPDWDLDEAVRRIAAQPDRTIGEALLDQRNLAGIGTFYRAELLFLHGVHPRTPVATSASCGALCSAVSNCFRQTAGVPSSPPPVIYDLVDVPTSTSDRANPAAAAEPPSAPRSSGRPAKSGTATGARTASLALVDRRSDYRGQERREGREGPA